MMRWSIQRRADVEIAFGDNDLCTHLWNDIKKLCIHQNVDDEENHHRTNEKQHKVIV
jgi:hypothetical protein